MCHRFSNRSSVLADVADDSVLFVGRKEIGDVAGIENGIDVLDETLVDDLRVGEEENDRRALHACHLEELFDVLPEIIVTVSALELD
jgi:hypothetical protein